MTHSTDDENVDLTSDQDEAGDADIDATPRATTPITPFGDAKPWAGSALSLDADEDVEPSDEADEPGSRSGAS